MDECARKTDDCDGNATCTNTIGDYNCTCYDGFSGDGYECKGKVCVFSTIMHFLPNVLKN